MLWKPEIENRCGSLRCLGCGTKCFGHECQIHLLSGSGSHTCGFLGTLSCLPLQAEIKIDGDNITLCWLGVQCLLSLSATRRLHIVYFCSKLHSIICVLIPSRPQWEHEVFLDLLSWCICILPPGGCAVNNEVEPPAWARGMKFYFKIWNAV